MSGGPPHHPHNRQQPSNPAWNHLQVPNYFPSRQLQHAHMSNEHPLLHQPTWHTPTTEPVKTMPHSHLFNLEQMIAERSYQRHAPGVDLSLQRNGSQNGDLPTSPISLSVRDANKINSLPAGAIDIQAVELTKSLSPGMKATKSSMSPGMKAGSPGFPGAGLLMHSPGLKSTSPGLKSASPGLKSASPVAKSTSPGLKSASPGLKSTSPGLKSSSPGLKTTAPVLKIATTSLVSSGGHGLLSTTPGIMCTATGLMMTSSSFGGLGTATTASPGVVLSSQIAAPMISPSPGFPLGNAILAAAPGVISAGSGMKSAGPLSPNQQNSPKNTKRSAKRVDSILERLNPSGDKTDKNSEKSLFSDKPGVLLEKEQDKSAAPDKLPHGHSVIVQPNTSAGNSHDENSNSSSVLTNVRDDDVVSPYSANEDSMDSSKSRRKRKPSKTVKVTKEEDRTEPERKIETPGTENNNLLDKEKVCKEEDTTEDARRLVEELEKDKEQQRRRSGSAPPGSPTPKKTRRKTSSESETIANIAAMVEETALLTPVTIKKEKEDEEEEEEPEKALEKMEAQESQEPTNDRTSKAISVSVIRDVSKEVQVPVETPSVPEDNTAPPSPPLPPPTAVSTPIPPIPVQKSFVEVENKLQEMFAGITDETDNEPDKSKLLDLDLEESRTEATDSKTDSTNIPTTSQPAEAVTSTSNDISPSSVKSNQKRKRKGGTGPSRSSESLSVESTPKKKKSSKKSKAAGDKLSPKKDGLGMKASKKLLNGKPLQNKVENFKDVYAYDSGSNASSSKSRGPFVQIRGPRDSPISISIVNTPSNEEDSDKKSHKSKKYHDDMEYRHKVRSKGLHCSTLSNKYDAQTRDATWICAFCKRGPHATDPTLPGPSPFNIYDNIPPPGDLFGPYIITGNSPEFERRIDDPFDKQFRSKKVARSLDAVTAKSSGKKSKRKHSDSVDSHSSPDSGQYLGITETKEKTFEVWAHEDCIVWSAGVYLVGSKIVGLEEAVWTSCNVTCNRCNYKGANVCCVKRGCTNVMHVGCARLSNWHLDEENYRAVCTEHKAP